MSPMYSPGRAAKTVSRKHVRIGVAAALVLLITAAFFDFPQYYNQGAKWLNARSGLGLPEYHGVDFALGLDLQGGAHLVYEADISQIPADERADAVEGVRDVIERRVNALGVSEPVVQTNRSGDTWRVIVELPGVTNVEQAIKAIGETPVLEFKEESPEGRTLTDEERAKLGETNEKEKARADEARKRAASGEDFAKLAQEFSDDAATKDKGGALGSQGEGGPYPRFVEWAKGAKPGAISPLIEDHDGYNVVRLIETRANGVEVRASHILICYQGAQFCQRDTAKEDARKLAEELKTKTTQSNFASLAAQNSTEPNAATTKGDLGWFGRGAMVKPFEDAVFAMQKGAISEIVESDFGFHLIYKTGERPRTEYDLARILVRKTTEGDILPPDARWKTTGLSGKQLVRAQLQFDNSGFPVVGLQFNDEGKELFAELTRRNVNKSIAVFLDGAPITVPVVNEPIETGNAVISGSFTIQSAKQLAQRLNAGALPVPISLVSQQTVGATLGRSSLDASIFAGLLGFAAVALFMMLYYRVPGLVAVVALCVYAAALLAIFKFLPVTLTLAGIAGLILSIGMAVDANVLIFERTKEELRAGRPLSSAIEEGFTRAWLSIRDSNASTLITCAILYWMGSSIVRGFAVTLALGVLASMFSSITVSRVLLRFVSPWIQGTRLVLGAKGQSSQPLATSH